jgi:hypothetical protein
VTDEIRKKNQALGETFTEEIRRLWLLRMDIGLADGVNMAISGQRNQRYQATPSIPNAFSYSSLLHLAFTGTEPGQSFLGITELTATLKHFDGKLADKGILHTLHDHIAGTLKFDFGANSLAKYDLERARLRNTGSPRREQIDSAIDYIETHDLTTSLSEVLLSFDESVHPDDASKETWLFQADVRWKGYWSWLHKNLGFMSVTTKFTLARLEVLEQNELDEIRARIEIELVHGDISSSDNSSVVWTLRPFVSYTAVALAKDFSTLGFEIEVPFLFR